MRQRSFAFTGSVKQRSIAFTGAEALATLRGEKTQARRAIALPHNNPLGEWEATTIGGPDGGRTASGETVPLQGSIWHTRTGDSLICPFGQPGDRLWVREAFRFTAEFNGDSPARVAERCLDVGYTVPWAPIRYEADAATRDWKYVGTPPVPDTAGRLRQARHMPIWASRLSLVIIGVRVERLQAVSESDARAEGYVPAWLDVNGKDVNAYGKPTYRQGFARLWRDTYGDHSWDPNPWVWVIEFRKIES